MGWEVMDIPEPFDCYVEWDRDAIFIECWCGWRKMLSHLMIEECVIPNVHLREWEDHYLNCDHALAIWGGDIYLDVVTGEAPESAQEPLRPFYW
jgi:hypothetical protein